MTRREWEALCDGCGKCCLNKLEDEDTGDVALTWVACRLFDDSTCRCAQYDHPPPVRAGMHRAETFEYRKSLYWMPETCAYKLLWQGKPLYDWHPLISGTPDSVHMRGRFDAERTVPEFEVHEDDWEDHIIEEPGT